MAERTNSGSVPVKENTCLRGNRLFVAVSETIASYRVPLRKLKPLQHQRGHYPQPGYAFRNKADARSLFLPLNFVVSRDAFSRGRNEASSHGETKESRDTRPLDGRSFASYPREYFSRVDTASRVAVLFDRLRVG